MPRQYALPMSERVYENDMLCIMVLLEEVVNFELVSDGREFELF